MKKTFAQLKKNLTIGNKLKCLEHNIRPERVGQVNEVVKKSGVAVFTLQNGKEVRLEYPGSANLVEYENNTFSFYEAGYRELTEEERKHIENMNARINESEFGNPYFIKQGYTKEHGCEHLLGSGTVRGMRYDSNRYRRNEPCIQDNSIKGEKLYSFEILN